MISEFFSMVKIIHTYALSLSKGLTSLCVSKGQHSGHQPKQEKKKEYEKCVLLKNKQTEPLSKVPLSRVYGGSAVLSNLVLNTSIFFV